MSLHFEVDIDRAVKELTEGFVDKEAEIRRAVNRAERKFTQWAMRQIFQIVSRASDVPQKILKERHRIQAGKVKTPNGEIGNIWVGLNPIFADQLGRPVKTDVGVKIGKFGEFYHAFIIKGDKVFAREGRERYPIRRALYAFHGPVEQAISRMELPARKRFMEILNQELDYAILHE